MRILVISQYFYPEDFRINSICAELVKKGHTITVVTGLPNYPQGEIFEGYENAYKSPEIWNGIKIIRCKNRPRKTGAVNLLLNYLSFAKECKKILKKISCEYDVIYSYQLSPINSVLPAIWYKKKHNIPLYIYVCDIWPESIRDFGKSKQLSTKNPVFLYFKHLSKKIYKSADFIGVKCDEFTDYLVSVCGVDKEKCFLNFEHAESNYLTVKETPIENGIIDLMYLGNIGHSSNCDLIIKAVSNLKGNNYKLHFVGDGSELSNLVRLSESLGLSEKVVFHGKVKQEEVLKYYDLADVCVLTLTGKSLIGMTPPAKLTGYMAANRPIIASAAGATKKIVESSDCGWVCDPDNEQSLYKLFDKVVNNPNILLRKGNNGREFFKENFTLEKHVDRLLVQLNQLINTRK